ncbi:MAG: GLUG motif-containing protein, partial [Ruminococcus sp.]
HNFPAEFDSNGFKTCSWCGADADVYEPAVYNASQNYYEISNAGQLYWFAGLVNGTLSGVDQNISANAVLTADITVNKGNTANAVANCDGIKADGWIDWTPIGTSETNFYAGTFDGQGHTVSGLYFNASGTSNVGLFGYICHEELGSDYIMYDGTIKNVGVVDSYFYGLGSVGGVCGESSGTITNCFNTSTVTGETSVGGVCGYNNKGIITNCYNTGAVTATGTAPAVGGVCGFNGYEVANCYYLDGTKSDNTATSKTAEEFASGEVAYLLSQGCTVGESEDVKNYDGSIWGQKLGDNGDTYPVLGGTKVYQNITYSDCGKTEISKTEYSNTDIPDVTPHEYTYTATNSVITETCKKCDTHNATATLQLDSDADLTYTGEEITPVSVTYSEGWQGSKELTVNYDNNINAGEDTAKASITINGATAELNFSIGKAELLPSEVNLKKVIYLDSSETGTKTLTATDLFDTDMPAGARIEGYTKTADENAIISDGSTVENGVFSYTPAVSADKAGNEATYEFTVSSKNYNDITVTVTFQVKEKNTVSITGVSVDNKIYDGKAMSYTGTPSALWNG